MKNSKGISLSINMVVLLTISLVVLLVVLAYFLGGFGDSGTKVSDIKKGAEIDTDWGGDVDKAMDVFDDECKVDRDCELDETCSSGECVDIV